MVMGGDSCSKGFGFVSQYHILDGQFSHKFVEKIVMMFFEKTKNKRADWLANLKKTLMDTDKQVGTLCWLQMVQTRLLFVYFLPFLYTMTNRVQNFDQKSVDGVLGIQPQDLRIVATYESTEQVRPPYTQVVFVYLPMTGLEPLQVRTLPQRLAELP